MILSFSNVAFAKTKNKSIIQKNVIKKEIVKPTEEKKSIDKVDKNTESVKIEVGDNSYQIMVDPGSTVYNAMEKLNNDKNSGFSFHSKEYSSLGNFVDSINGVPGTPGKYWLYYLDGKKASMGVSKNKIKSGDVVTWKQESF
ncbi:MAG: DUF4430 domain-containing protein [Candidatus Nomurabacteria bacterium]|nr:DUF4430 domain-containing protein [Candidatus Nomurabacteria bacterium]